MHTTLKSKAYWIPIVLFVLPIFAWRMLAAIQENSAVPLDYSSYLSLIAIVCYGILIYSLLVDYQEYSFDNEVLIMKNLINKKQHLIKLREIRQIKLHKKRIKNLSYHNIFIETNNGTYILKGLYVNDMVQFFSELERTLTTLK